MQVRAEALAIDPSDDGGVDLGLFRAGDNFIQIHEGLLNAVEQGVEGAAELLEVIVEHEVAHFLDISVDGQQNRDANGGLIEEGNLFEEDVYGKRARPSQAILNAIILHAIDKVANGKKEKKEEKKKVCFKTGSKIRESKCS